MRKLLVAATLAAAAIFAVMGTSTALADSDPTMDQIYTAAAGGHLDQAQQMITQVLADHPTSAKAHYVQAELYSKEGKTALARSELATAEQLKPGLPFANPRSVQELKAQLGLRTGTFGNSFGSPTVVRPVPAERRFPWGTVLVLAGVVAVLWMLFRRRRTYAQYPAAGAGPGAPGTYGPGYGPGGYGPGPMGGGGVGSGIAGGLASGLAVGAGVVAGEELAHHFLDGGRSSGGVIPPAEAGEQGLGNSDMGGSDFGVNDPGSGWDDAGGGGFDGGGGGGGDWS
jgi:hypothetical protein